MKLVHVECFSFLRFENEVSDRPKSILSKYDETALDEVQLHFFLKPHSFFSYPYVVFLLVLIQGVILNDSGEVGEEKKKRMEEVCFLGDSNAMFYI